MSHLFKAARREHQKLGRSWMRSGKVAASIQDLRPDMLRRPHILKAVLQDPTFAAAVPNCGRSLLFDRPLDPFNPPKTTWISFFTTCGKTWNCAAMS